MKKIISDPKILIAINALHQTMLIFFGPFLTVYLITLDVGSISKVSIFYTINYLFLALGWYILGSIFRDKFKINQMRVGVILNFLFILLIIVLGDNIVKYIWLVAALYGLCRSFFDFPKNMLASEKVSNKTRTKYEVRNYLAISFVSIVVPVTLGSLITISDYRVTAFFILIIAALQILLTFLLEESKGYDNDFDIQKSWKKLRKDKNIKLMMIAQFFNGMVFQKGALETLVAIMIFVAFKTNFYLGLITSIATLLSTFVSYFYEVYFKGKSDKSIIIVACIVPIISLIILLLTTNNITIIVYAMCYTIFLNLLNVIQDIRMYKLGNSKTVTNNLVTEYFVLKESCADLGRSFSFIVLLILAIVGMKFLGAFLLFFAVISIIGSVILLKIDKHII